MLQIESYGFVKLRFVTNDIGSVLGKKGLLFAEGGEHEVHRKLLLPALSLVHIKGLVLGFWSKGGNDRK